MASIHTHQEGTTDPNCPSCLRSALSRLVELKDGPRDSVYLREKPKAWAAARKVLGLPDPGGID